MNMQKASLEPLPVFAELTGVLVSLLSQHRAHNVKKLESGTLGCELLLLHTE